MEHGTRAKYNHDKCKCDMCREANTVYTRERNAAKTPTNSENVPHGTYNGYVYHKCRCDLCVAANHEYRRTRRDVNRDRINSIKIEKGCIDCGYNEHPVALDFDHVRGEKSFSISQGVLRPWEVILDEIEKCEVVCSNCHRIRTFNRWRNDT